MPRGKRTKHSDGSTTVSGKRGNGQGSVFFEKNRSGWVGSWIDVNGKRRKTTGKTRERAERKLAEKMTALPDGPPLVEAAELWLEAHAKTGDEIAKDLLKRLRGLTGNPIRDRPTYSATSLTTALIQFAVR